MKLKFRTKFFYGLGESPNVISRVIKTLLFLYFLTDVVGLEPGFAGTVLMIGGILDAFTDPLLGILSDRTHTRWGRRRPFILFSAIPLGLCFFLMWVPYPVESQAMKMLFYTVPYLCYLTCITCYHIPYISLFPEMTDDYTERTSITLFRQFFASFFGLLTAVLPKMIIDSYADKALGFVVATAPAAILVALIPFIIFGTIKERDIDRPAKQGWASLIDAFKYAVKSRAFVTLLFLFVGSWSAVAVIESFTVYYMKYWLLNEPLMPFVFVAVVSTSILGLPMWSFLTKRIGKKKTAIIGLLMWAVPQLFYMVLTPTTPFAFVIALGALMGVGYGGAHIFSWAMFPDVMDDSEVKTGERNDGLYAGILYFIEKGAASFALFLLGVTLQISGYVPNIPQTDVTLQTIRMLMTFAPLVFVLIALTAALFFPITVERYKEIRAELDKKEKA
ncbi:MAG: MFS transporter [Deltaproteobacteria bacterium]|nr:MFS transporter [Deltaproteobacteria bacterium]